MGEHHFLTEDGAIFISIDDNEVENLKKICNELFGESNYVATIVWKRKRGRDNSARWFSKSHEYVLVYAKSKSNFSTNKLELDEETKKAYKNPDKDERGPYRLLGCWARGTQGGVKYSFESNDGHFFSERLWLFSKDNLKKLDEEKKLVFHNDNVYRKMFIYENEGKIPETLWDNVSNAANASDEIKKLFGKIVFDTPKPTPYIEEMLRIATDKDSTVLDFFSGSATTAEAVMQLNSEDGGHRKFILVQIPEKCDLESPAFKDGFANICEIGKERIRRAGKEIVDSNGLLSSGLDVGFRDLIVDSSNMKDVYYSAGGIRQGSLDDYVSNIKDDRKPLDLVFQVMLDLGISLSSSIDEKKIHGKDVFFVGGNNLVACFDSGVGDDILEELAKSKPLYACFRDSTFGGDSSSVNCEQIFKTMSPVTKVKVI